MDDFTFQKWSEKLSDFRKKRQALIEQEIQAKIDSFDPKAFYEVAMASLENIMEAWFDFEKQSWDQHLPENIPVAIEDSIREMESILDFEIDALDRDKAAVVSKINWQPNDDTNAFPAFQSFTDELRKRFQIKIHGLGKGEDKKKTFDPTPLPTKAAYSGRSNGGSSVGLFVMFLVGLLFGGAPSIYFMDVSKKVERKFQEERSKMLTDQRVLADNMTVLHDNFVQLALGKSKNIAELDKEIGKIKAGILERKQRIESEYQKDHERIIKKIPAGDKQDKAIADLDAEKQERLNTVRRDEAVALEPLEKKLELLKDLIK